MKHFVFIIFCLVGLTACSQNAPSQLTGKRIMTAQQNMFQGLYDTPMFGEAQAASIANAYYKTGTGPVSITVYYDPAVKAGNAALEAGKHAGRIAALIRGQHVTDIDTSIRQIGPFQEFPATLITFDTLTVVEPDCEMIPGLYGTPTDWKKAETYEFGCTNERMFARQIARPKDVAGHAGLDNEDGRRASNIIETHRSGVPNQAIEGQEATGE